MNICNECCESVGKDKYENFKGDVPKRRTNGEALNCIYSMLNYWGKSFSLKLLHFVVRDINLLRLKDSKIQYKIQLIKI